MHKNNLKNGFKHPSPAANASTSPAGGEVLNSAFNASALNVMLERERCELSRASRNIKSILLNEGNSFVFRFLNVITGLVPVILVQRDSYLVNKFASLFKRSILFQDCRNRLCVMSGNDWCWKRLFMFFPFLKLLNRMYHPGSSANELTLKAKDDYKSTLQCGRSMIEMLGVLAIIAVLSVGGIAGYSKAMEKFKVNKAMHEYSLIIFSLLEHLDSLKNLSTDKDWNAVSILPYMQQTGLVTDAWTQISERELNDPYGNTIAFFSRHHNLVVDLTLGSLLVGEDATTSPAFSATMCREYFINLVIPLQSSLIHARLYKLTGTTSSSAFFYGNSTCGSDKKCLHSMNIGDVNDICNSCSKDSACVINLEF